MTQRYRSKVDAFDELRLKVEDIKPTPGLSAFETWHEFPLPLNGWVNYNNTVVEERGAYWKSLSGIVMLRGLVKNGTIGLPLGVLPAHFRPFGIRRFPVLSGGALGYMEIQAGGLVTVIFGNTSYVTLDGIVFRAEQ